MHDMIHQAEPASTKGAWTPRVTRQYQDPEALRCELERMKLPRAKLVQIAEKKPDFGWYKGGDTSQAADDER
jgi:hypothetical protein